MRRIITLCLALLMGLPLFAQSHPERLVVYRDGKPVQGFLTDRTESVTYSKPADGNGVSFTVLGKDNRSYEFLPNQADSVVFRRITAKVAVDAQVNQMDEKQISFTLTPSSACKQYRYVVVTNSKGQELIDEVAAAAYIEQNGSQLFDTKSLKHDVPADGLSKGNTYTLLTLGYDEFGTPCKVTRYSFNYMGRYRRRSLITQYTGTWCGNCPPVIASIHHFMENDPNLDDVAFAAIHARDALETGFATNVRTYEGVSSYPRMYINFGKEVNKNTNPTMGAKTIRAMVNAQNKIAARTGIAATVSEVDDKGNVTFDTKLSVTTRGMYRMAVWVVEDNVYSKQSDNSGSYDSEVISNHMNVLRASTATNAAGDIISETDIPANTVVEYKRTLNLQELKERNDIKDIKNCRFIVVVTYNQGGTKYAIDNVLPCKFGETRNFECIP